jgi:hypothetical protein
MNGRCLGNFRKFNWEIESLSFLFLGEQHERYHTNQGSGGAVFPALYLLSAVDEGMVITRLTDWTLSWAIKKVPTPSSKCTVRNPIRTTRLRFRTLLDDIFLNLVNRNIREVFAHEGK